ncbi:YesL family protein [Metabacillus dongyingensis]|nr:YesL family protein [Metabacillus dongyingensis]
MELNGFYSGIFRVFEWITRLVGLNILWLLFTISGLILFGIFPATAAMFAVARKWVLGDENIRVFHFFWRSFKKEFWKSQLLGYLFLLISFILFIDIKFFLDQGSLLSKFMLLVSINLTIVFLVVIVFLFPAFVHFDWKLFQYLNRSLLIAILNPKLTILMITGLFGSFFIYRYIPMLIPFFGTSAVACYLTWIAQRSFRIVEEKRKKFQFGSVS